MRAFDLDRNVVERYAAFSRSFSNIRAGDLREAIDHQYDGGRFWPDALLSINPQYEPDKTVDELASEGSILSETAAVFRRNGNPIRLHRHQAEALACVSRKDSFVVTTGTGSGKSLCFFLPIVDAAIKARIAGEKQCTRAIVI